MKFIELESGTLVNADAIVSVEIIPPSVPPPGAKRKSAPTYEIVMSVHGRSFYTGLFGFSGGTSVYPARHRLSGLKEFSRIKKLLMESEEK